MCFWASAGDALGSGRPWMVAGGLGQIVLAQIQFPSGLAFNTVATFGVNPEEDSRRRAALNRKTKAIHSIGTRTD